MSDDFGDIGDFYEVSDLFDKPDIHDYMTFSEPESEALWEEAWDIAPTQDMTEGQLEAFIDFLLDTDYDDWQETLDEMLADFWEWFDSEYSEA